MSAATRTINTGKIQAIDLFCGAGGLTHGLARAGIDVRLGIDIDPACEYPYVHNNKARFWRKSVEELHAEEVAGYYRKNAVRLLAGGAPCQTFSNYNRKATQIDKRWWLLKHFARLLKELQPELLTMENVPQLAGQNVFREFVATLEDLRYFVTWQIVNCADYGVPQRRRRLVFLASRSGPVPLLGPQHFGREPANVRQAIGDLPALQHGGTDPDDPLHRCAALSSINLRRMQASRPGGSWRDWPAELVADCHKKDSGKTYASVYGRMQWDRPSPTITTQFSGFGNGRFGHPEQDRALSLREGAILQGFPPDYQFLDPDKQIGRGAIGRLIGNAVPVSLGELIGASLLAYTAGQTESLTHQSN